MSAKFWENQIIQIIEGWGIGQYRINGFAPFLGYPRISKKPYPLKKVAS